jgi:hypothetical protein
MPGIGSEPTAVRLFLLVEVGIVAFFLFETIVAWRVLMRLKRHGSVGLSKRARRPWALAGLVLLTFLGIYTSVVITYRRDVQLRRIREREAVAPVDREPRKALVHQLRIEMYTGAAALAGFVASGMLWQQVVRTERKVPFIGQALQPLQKGSPGAIEPR